MTSTHATQTTSDRVGRHASVSSLWWVVAAPGLFGLTGCGPTDDSTGGASGSVNREEDETPSYAMAQSEMTKASEENPQVVNGDVIEDYDYAVTLRRPSSDWRFLDEKKIAEMNPDAILGVVHLGRRSFSMLIVERMDDISLEKYGRLILGESPFAQGTELDRQSVTIDGCPGLVFKYRTTVEGIDFTYRLQFVQRDNFFYYFTCWTMTDNFGGVESQFDTIGDSLSFIKDREPRVRVVSGSGNDQGPDWRIADNVCSNASFGFRLQPADGWRLPGHEELKIMNVDASAGLVSATPTFYQIFLIEPVGDTDRREYLDATLERIRQDLGIEGPHPEPADVEMGGVAAQERIYRRVDTTGSLFDFAQTTFFRDSTFFRIQSWWPSAQAEEAAPRLAESYQFLDWLSDNERQDLEQQLAGYDANNAVGIDFSYRNGVFRDFEYGYSLKAPPGLWQALTGDTLHVDNPDSRLILNHLAHGIYVNVVPEAADLGHDEYHRILRNNLEIPPDAPIRKQRGNNVDLLVSSARFDDGGLGISYRLVTAARGQRLVQILMNSLQSNERLLDARLAEVINGFDFSVTQLPMTERGRSRFVDHRLGFEVLAPRGWSFQSKTPPQIQPLGTIVLAEGDDVWCTAVAAWIPGGFDEEMVIDAIANNGGIAVTPGSRRDRKCQRSFWVIL